MKMESLDMDAVDEQYSKRAKKAQLIDVEPEEELEDESTEVELASESDDDDQAQEVATKESDESEVDDPAYEIEDDTPPDDRGRKTSEPPEDVTEEELSQYSKRAKDRLRHFTKSYHDERRAKEQALRERQAAEEYARNVRAEYESLKQQFGQAQTEVQTASQSRLESELASAKQEFRNAYESGDTEALEAAQDRILDTKLALQELKLTQAQQPVAKPLPEGDSEVYNQQQPQYEQQQQYQQPAQQPTVDEKAVAWHSENQWFGQDALMTQFAQGLHVDLVSKGTDPTSNKYYETINSRMRKAFPEYDWGDASDSPEPEIAQTRAPKPASRKTSAVAPASRSTSSRKITLSSSQVNFAKRNNIPLEEMARQVAQLKGEGQ